MCIFENTKRLAMKNLKRITISALLSTVVFIGLTSFQSKHVKLESIAFKSNIEFKIENDFGKDFQYCANGGHNTISKSTTKTMSYPVGTEIKYIDGGNCANTWFKVTSEMNGKTFKISQMAR
jgi:hypothetical protein